MNALRKELGISVRDWRVVRDAAAGMGGVIEHLGRAFDASVEVDKS